MKGILLTIDEDILAIDGGLPLNAFKCTSEISRDDMRWFREHTLYSSVVMGWNTWVSLGEKPLKDRKTHYIITSRKDLQDTDGVRFVDLGQFKELMQHIDGDELWLMGGATLYGELLPLCSSIYWNTLEGFSLPFSCENRLLRLPRHQNTNNTIYNTLSHDWKMRILKTSEYTVGESKCVLNMRKFERVHF